MNFAVIVSKNLKIKIKMNSQFLNKLNNLGMVKPIKSLSEINPDTYLIKNGERIRTIYGAKIVLEMESFKVFLPSKFNELSDEEIALFSGYFLKVSETSRQPKIEFLPPAEEKVNIKFDK